MESSIQTTEKTHFLIPIPSVRTIGYALCGLPVMAFIFLMAMQKRADDRREAKQFLKMECPIAAIPVKTEEVVKTGKKGHVEEVDTGVNPVWGEKLGTDKQQQFIQRYHKVAIDEMRKFGIPASIALAQGLIESRAGTSTLAVKANNFFGIKCMSRRCSKGHCVNATDDSHKDFFVKYQSPWYSWRAHSQLLSGGRYAKLP